jgi:L-histidine N-alpha-methyltransferase
MAPLVVTDAIVVEWIEMRLRAQRRMAVHVRKLALEVAFAPREELRTEISAKFTHDRLRADLTAAGLVLREVLTDPTSSSRSR